MFHTKKGAALLALLMLVLAVLSACAPKAAPTPTAAPAEQPAEATEAPEATEPAAEQEPAAEEEPTAEPIEETEEAVGGGSVIRVDFADAENLNSILYSDTASDEVASLIYDALVTLHPETGEVLPQLATRWEVSEDELTYTYYLRDDVTWHDGEPFTAEDVKYTYEMILNEGVNSPRRADFEDLITVDNIEIIDEHTISFTLNRIDASWLCCKDIYGILPEHVLADLTPEEFNNAEFNRAPVGTGPFVFKEWVKDDHITLTKNADYWAGEPKADTYHFKVVENETVAFAQLQTGEGDVAEVTAALWDEAQQTDGLMCQDYPRFSFTFYTYNLDPEKTTLFQDVRVRRALLLALDRQAMVDSIVFGLADVAHSVVPPVSWAHNPDNEPRYPYDPEQAKALLEEAGWRDEDGDGVREAYGVEGVEDGTLFEFEINTNAGNQEREQNIVAMQQFWAQIGVAAKPVPMEWNALLDKLMKTYDFDVVLIGFAWDIDPDQSTMWHTDSYGGGFNMNKYSNPELDEVLDAAVATTDREERRELYFEMQRILAEDVPAPILYFRRGTECFDENLQNYTPSDINHWFDAHEWYVAE